MQGLLRMSLLPRLRYILEVWRPSAAIVTNILDILVRIARHSTQAAYEVGALTNGNVKVLWWLAGSECCTVENRK